MNERKTSRRRDLNVPNGLDERFNRVWPRHSASWSAAIHESMNLYLDKYEAKEAEKQ